ncbi:hypothetical protein QBC47DRAFT_186891 [Echria macrotheca]|uniref:Thioredoxin-like fold domain-containing protein n=1 Tax=Echria macrotheca TaxID=438768 RepID=A0AAJ0BII4_9PEZI|nr:hypothetical protein QBC47DRAFT_186891 [Echria macrotheca]
MPPKTSPQLTIYRGFIFTGCHVWSPFVNKLETRLRLAGIPYRTAAGSMREAPRGKIPYLSIEDDDGNRSMLADTALITRDLVALGVLSDLNAGLSPAERAQDLAIRALLEDKLSFYLARERWVDNFYAMRAGALAALPWPVQIVVGQLAYRNVVKALYGQGTGRYTADEARAFKREIWEALSAVLVAARDGEVAVRARRRDPRAPFWTLGRAGPTEVDATVYGFVAASLVCTAAPETGRMVREFEVLVDYAGRIREGYFGDYDAWDEEV